MPVSKNKRKNHKSVNQRDLKNKQRALRENSALKVLGRGLHEFNKIRENIRLVARMYVDVTKSIEGYQETDPSVHAGLTEAIPLLKAINLRYDALTARVAQLAKGPMQNQLDYVEEVQELESLYYELGHNFMDHFIPVVSALERLGEAKGIDKVVVSETRQAIDSMKPKFETATA
jgi:hypothetical protein